MAVDLRNTLAHALDEALPATLLFDHPTLNSLAEFSIALIAPKQRSAESVQIREEGEDLLALIEGLSDGEVEARWMNRTSEVAFTQSCGFGLEDGKFFRANRKAAA